MFNESTETQARRLSSGTLAGLTGVRRYSEIDSIRDAFVLFCKGKRGPWQTAWGEFYWTVARVKAELPPVKVRLGSKGKVVDARIAGRACRFAGVMVPDGGWEFARTYEFAWATIAHCLNTGGVLLV